MTEKHMRILGACTRKAIQEQWKRDWVKANQESTIPNQIQYLESIDKDKLELAKADKSTDIDFNAYRVFVNGAEVFSGQDLFTESFNSMLIFGITVVETKLKEQ